MADTKVGLNAEFSSDERRAKAQAAALAAATDLRAQRTQVLEKLEVLRLQARQLSLTIREREIAAYKQAYEET